MSPNPPLVSSGTVRTVASVSDLGKIVVPTEREFQPSLSAPWRITLPNSFVISDDRDRLDMDFIHASIAASYWAIGRPRALTERSWANSLCLGLYAPDRQVGFGRILTDRALRAHIADVFVDPASRGLGLGRSLVDAMLSHPDLATVARWTLTTADAQSLDATFGFRAAEADGTSMTLDRSPQRGE